jgi:cytochrome c biogenesis protein CcmG/thiol:disulfide interchange protein DsbE
MSGEASPRPGTRWGCLITWCVVALALLGLALALARSSAAPPRSGPAPDFTLTSYDGETITLSGLRGQVVVINFWASSCDYCADEASDLERAWQDYCDQGVVFVGVDFKDSDAEGRKFIERYGITYPNGPDLGNRISDMYVIVGMPETFIIDRQGEIVFFAMRPLSFEELSAEIEKLLGS